MIIKLLKRNAVYIIREVRKNLKSLNLASIVSNTIFLKTIAYAPILDIMF